MATMRSRVLQMRSSSFAEQGYQAAQCRRRVDMIQDALKQKNKDMALVIVPGQDGCQNQFSQVMLKFILEGDTGVSLQEPTIDDEELEDTVIVISGDAFDVYCCPEKLQEFDAELFKINSFVAMTERWETLLVPFSKNESDAEGHDIPGFEIEKWPLIQATALEDVVGRRGFFTQRHHVIEASGFIAPLLNQLDGRSVDSIIQETLPRLEFHWNRFTNTLDRMGAGGRSILDTESLAKPLQTFFQYSNMTLPETLRRPDMAKVLLGSAATLSRPWTVPTSSSSPEHASQSSDPLHFVATLSDPRSALIATRTYFLTAGTNLEKQVKQTKASRYHVDLASDESLEASTSLVNNCNAKKLFKVYACLAAAVRAAIESFKLDESQHVRDVASFVALPSMVAISREICSEDELFELTERTSFRLLMVDAFGQESEYASSSTRVREGNQLATISAHISLGELGGVAFGDSFLMTSTSSSFDCLVLTLSIPVAGSWTKQGAQDTHRAQIEACLQTSDIEMALGKLLHSSSSKNERLITGLPSVPYVFGRLSWFSNGFALTSGNSAPIIVNLADQVSEIEIVDSGQTRDVFVVLKLKISDSSELLPMLDAFASSDNISNRMLAIPLSPNTSSRQMFYSRILPAWKHILQSFDIDLSAPNECPSELLPFTRETFEMVEDKASRLQMMKKSISGSGEEGMSSTESSAGCGDVSITVLLGHPASYPDQIAQQIQRLDSKHTQWHIVKQRADERDPCHFKFNARTIQNDIAECVESIKDSSSSNGSISHRIVFVSSSFESASDVASSLRGVENVKVASIGTVVDVDEFFESPSSCSVLPHVLDQATRGLCNFIVLKASSQSARLEEVEQHLRWWNPTAKIVRSLNDSGGMEILRVFQSEDAFYEQAQATSRKELSSSVCSGEPHPNSWSSFSQKVPFPISIEATIVPKSDSKCNDQHQLPLIWARGQLLVKNNGEEGCLADVKISPFKGLSITPMPDCHPSTEARLWIHGPEANEAAFLSLLDRYVPELQQKTIRDRSSVKPSEMESLRTEFFTKPLPSGYYFDGSQYVHSNEPGYHEHFRPDMEQIVQNFLAEQNSSICAHNERAQALRSTLHSGSME